MRLIYMALLTLLGTSLLGIPATAGHIIQISDGNDDAEEQGNGTTTLTGTSVLIESQADNTSADYRAAGFRFQNVPIGDGDEVTLANVELYVTTQDDMNVTIYAHDSDNSPNFATLPQFLDNSDRAKTDNYVHWIELGIGTNAWDNTDNIATMIQEVLDRPGWEEGNALTILFIPIDDQPLESIARTQEFGAGTNAAKLHLFWSPTITYNQAPASVAPGSVFRVEQDVTTHGEGAADFSAKITFSHENFRFLDGYPENDITIENEPSGAASVDAVWYIAAPINAGDYTYNVVWGLTHGDFHTLTSDNYDIEVKTPRSISISTVESINPQGNVGIPTTGGGEGIGILAAGMALIAVALSVVAMRGD